MNWLQFVIDVFLHLDKHLATVLQTFGGWTYALLFFTLFLETGFVVTPFLPGDSLLFAAGTFAALGDLNLALLFLVMASGAILGDTVNYWVGHFIGPRAFSGEIKYLKKEHLDRTHEFYEKYGGFAVVVGRFVPIVRTFVPFVAGIGTMTYSHFITYNVLGAVAWTGLFLGLGYFFGNIPVVKDNFSLVIIGIIAVSVLPGVWEYYKAWRARRGAAAK
ncbi:MAG TPA: DedA family protein [Chloroflexi bacterium]|nr:DedA family protein [Chloroflexota bacterium]